ncbi:MAG: ABC transporter ATP-binding protein/permease [Planctomycetales bacterium]|nr:ABC transporter ATP-binding protein/permease [Planctomycetales bacterium]
MTLRETLRPILEALRPAVRERRLLLGLVAATVLYAVCSPARALALVPALEGLKERDVGRVGLAAALLAGLAAGLAVGQFGIEYFRRALQDRLVVDLRKRALANLLRLPMGFHASAKIGEITSRLTSDVEYARAVLRVALGDFLQCPLHLLAGAAMALAFTWSHRGGTTLAVALLLSLPLMTWPVVRFGRRIRSRTRRSLAALGELLQSFQQALTGIRQVKAFGAEEEQKRRFAEEGDRFYRSSLRVVATEAWNTGLTEATYGFAAAGLLVAGGVAMAKGWVELPALLTVGGILVTLYHPMRSLVRGVVVVQESLAGLDRVLELCEPAPALPEKPGARRLDGFRDRIELAGVRFSYDGAPGPSALDGVTLAIRRGETVVVTGPSGAGKSTFLDLLLRIHDPSTGSVRVDGTDVRDVTRESLCALMGVVTQEPFLFHDTVAENLRYGRPAATEAEVEAAARAANIHEEIAALTEGYRTLVGERGVRLSGGQRQRITIARALLRDAPILLLDEALASIDPEGRAAVEEAIERLRAGRTTIAVTHDLRGRLVEGADRIVVLEEGKVVEEGTYAELAARDGPFRRLLRGTC